MKSLHVFRIATGLTLLALLLGLVYASRDETAGNAGVIETLAAPGASTDSVLPPRGDAAPLTFENHLGESVSELDYRGGHTLVFFGYASCPDVCPGNLAAMTGALADLGAQADRVQPLFVSFDPDRDTPEVLAEYVAQFHPRLVGLTGTRAQIEAATRAYGVYFKRDPGGDASASAGDIIHSSNTYLVGPDGRGLSIFSHNTPPDEMAEAIRRELAKES